MAKLYDDEHPFSYDVDAENEEEAIQQQQIHQLDEFKDAEYTYVS